MLTIALALLRVSTRGTPALCSSDAASAPIGHAATAVLVRQKLSAMFSNAAHNEVSIRARHDTALHAIAKAIQGSNSAMHVLVNSMAPGSSVPPTNRQCQEDCGYL
ncbi:unnamed protein product [Aphanomyces euteiches]